MIATRITRILLLSLLLPFAAQAQTTAPAAPAAAEATVDTTSPPKVLIKTSLGDITVELDAVKAPKSVENFLQYVKDGFYDGTIFHRVIDGFMIQGGGFTPDLRQKPTRASIQNEAKNGLSNRRGTIAMARTPDPNSATAQFFINVVDNRNLDYVNDDTYGYAVFGTVVSGMDVVDRIKATPTGPKGPFPRDVPATDIVIEKVSVVE